MARSSGWSRGWSNRPASSSRQSTQPHPGDVVDHARRSRDGLGHAEQRSHAVAPEAARVHEQPIARRHELPQNTWLSKGTSSGHQSTTGRSWMSSGATVRGEVLRQLAAERAAGSPRCTPPRSCARRHLARGVDAARRRSAGAVGVAGREDDGPRGVLRRRARRPRPSARCWVSAVSAPRPRASARDVRVRTRSSPGVRGSASARRAAGPPIAAAARRAPAR